MPPRVYNTPQSGGNIQISCTVDLGDLPTLPDRLTDAFNQALIFHLEDAAQRVIDRTRHYLVRLEEPAVKTNPYGKPIHGYDTGVMYVSLKYQLAVALLMTGVFYDLLSEEAEYWRFMEFGFTMANGEFWPGYHMLETAIADEAGYIRQRVREAWQDTAIRLALEAHVPGRVGRLGFTDGLGLP